MINYSDKGFSLFHRFLLLIVVSVWFWIALKLWELMEISLITLPLNYLVSALIGLLFSAFGSLQNYGEFYSWNALKRIRSSVMKSNFQVAVMAFCVFAAYFIIRDIYTSRFFLAFFICSCWPLLIFSNFAIPGVFKRLNGYYGLKRSAI